MNLCTAVQEGCGYKDTLRAHRYFAPLVKYFTVCITYQPAYVILYSQIQLFMCKKTLRVLDGVIVPFMNADNTRGNNMKITLDRKTKYPE
jgi:hypothetical protein